MRQQSEKKKTGLVMVTYLLGIFMGAIDTGIVTPARTIIQNGLGVDDKTGIWMITIYTLAYAASIPIMGKLADRYGRKYIYLVSILLFGFGSLLCGLSQNFGSFSFLLAARAIQAIGGGGILPVATAEFGTTFPKEKRGMALGLVGGVYGVANIFGASTGSAILDLFGTANWQFIFYINVPITVFILLAGLFCLPNTKASLVRRIDIEGITVLTVMVLSLLYGLKNIDFFDFTTTIASPSVYPFLVAFVVLLPLFLLVERKADDPVINLSFFRNSRIVIALILSFITGIVMMGMIFVPQFSENALRISSGSGGYFVLALGLFAGIGAPVSGKMIDRFGVKVVLGFGFAVSVIGAAFLILITASFPNLVTVLAGLMLIGIGIGFTMGAPLNYMMLDNVKKEESNSALATLSLIRSIGTAIAPAIMIGFIANAGVSVQGNVMNLLPHEVHVPPLPYAQELTDELNRLKEDPATEDMFLSISMPDLTAMQRVEIDMSGRSGFDMPADVVELMQSSDVTTITDHSKRLAERMFSIMLPGIKSRVESGITSGSDGMTAGLEKMDTQLAELQKAFDGLSEGISGMNGALSSLDMELRQLEGWRMTVATMPAAALAGLQTSDAGLLGIIPENVRSSIPTAVQEKLVGIRSLEDLDTALAEMRTVVLELTAKRNAGIDSLSGMSAALDAMQAARLDLAGTIVKMTEMKAAVPSAFEAAKDDYLLSIENIHPQLENIFQKTMNDGFRQVYFTAGVAALLAMAVLAFYKGKRHACQ